MRNQKSDMAATRAAVLRCLVAEQRERERSSSAGTSMSNHHKQFVLQRHDSVQKQIEDAHRRKLADFSVREKEQKVKFVRDRLRREEHQKLLWSSRSAEYLVGVRKVLESGGLDYGSDEYVAEFKRLSAEGAAAHYYRLQVEKLTADGKQTTPQDTDLEQEVPTVLLLPSSNMTAQDKFG
jgi:hypothetical protein